MRAGAWRSCHPVGGPPRLTLVVAATSLSTLLLALTRDSAASATAWNANGAHIPLHQCIGLAAKAANEAIVPGRGLSEFKRALEEDLKGSRDRRIFRQVSVIGNSVARANGFGTARRMLEVLRDSYPGLELSTPRWAQGVKGGFHPDHLVHCGASAWEGADVVLVQYEILAKHNASQQLLEGLLNQPNRPLVVAIKHCSLPLVEAQSGVVKESAWVKSYNKNSTRDLFDWMLAFQSADDALLRQTNVTMIDSCRLIKMFLSGALGSDYKLSLDGVKNVLFPRFYSAKQQRLVTDSLHQSATYSALQGCLAATALINASPSSLPQAPFPSASSVAKKRSFCIQAGSAEWDALIKSNSGWELKTGGKGGQKRWVQASQLGSKLAMSMPSVPNTIHLEHYTHDNLPMATIKASVLAIGNESSVRRVESVSASGKCFDCLAGQGFYRKVKLAENIKASLLPGEKLQVELELVEDNGQQKQHINDDRDRELLKQASIVTIIGEM